MWIIKQENFKEKPEKFRIPIKKKADLKWHIYYEYVNTFWDVNYLVYIINKKQRYHRKWTSNILIKMSLSKFNAIFYIPEQKDVHT